MGWIRDGVITLTNGSKTVTGTGTAWLAGGVIASGGLKTPIGIEEIGSVLGDTTLELVMPYAGPSASNIPYAVIPTQGMTLGLTVKATQLLGQFGIMKGDYEAGNLGTDRLATANGAAAINTTAPGPGSVTRTLEQALYQSAPSFLSMLTPAEIADCLSFIPTIDLSAKIQAYINANKGGYCFFPGPYKYLHASIMLDGPSYLNTQIHIAGEFVLRRASPAAESTGGYPVFTGMLVRDCDGVVLNYRGHGNRDAMPQSEQIYLLVVAGATRFKCPSFIAREVRGDGCYITQKNFNAASTIPNDLYFGNFEVTNSADDGRNAMTVISAANMVIDRFKSEKVGGVVAGITEPGGLCFEPNNANHVIENITIGTVHIVTAGGCGLQINGAAGTTTPARNVAIGTANVINTSWPNTNSPVTGVPVANQFRVLNVVNVDGLSIGVFRGRFTNAYGDGIAMRQFSNVQMPNAVVEHVRVGAYLGIGVAAIDGVNKNNRLHIVVKEPIQGGIQVSGLQDSTITGRVHPVVNGHYASKFAVWSLRAAGGEQTNVTYGVTVDYSANWTRAYRNDASFPVPLTNCRQVDCDMTGYDGGLGADMELRRFNVRGLTNMTGFPSGGKWIAGQEVSNDTPTVSNGKMLLGWRRITTGASNTGADWLGVYGTTS